jgi:hypothetical protein
LLLRDLAGALLAPLAALKLAANAPGFAPDGRLAVLTADGCAVAADKVAVDDAPWLLRRLRPGVVHVASYFELYSWPATTEPRSVLLLGTFLVWCEHGS